MLGRKHGSPPDGADTENASRDKPSHGPWGRKRFAMCVTGALALGCMAGGILAYQTDTDVSGNRFTIGNVRITAMEPKFPTRDTDRDTVPDECEDLTPFEEVTKDPRIQNTGKNDCIVFFRMTAPVEELTLVNDDGTRGQTALNDLFWFKMASDSASLHANHFNPNWIRLDGVDGQIVSCAGINDEGRGKVYIFGYHVRLKPSQYTDNLFDKVQNKKYGSRTIRGEEIEQVRLESFAIQADDICSSGMVGSKPVSIKLQTGGQLSKADLTYIYKAFVNQNEATVGRGSWR